MMEERATRRPSARPGARLLRPKPARSGGGRRWARQPGRQAGRQAGPWPRAEGASHAQAQATTRPAKRPTQVDSPSDERSRAYLLDPRRTYPILPSTSYSIPSSIPSPLAITQGPQRANNICSTGKLETNLPLPLPSLRIIQDARRRCVGKDEQQHGA